MQTGIKAVDQLISKHGIMADLGADTFQRRTRLTGGDERANALPFCMYQKVARWVQVCRKLQQLVQVPTSDVHMAA